MEQVWVSRLILPNERDDRRVRRKAKHEKTRSAKLTYSSDTQQVHDTGRTVYYSTLHCSAV